MSGKDLYIIQSRVTGAVKVGRSDNPERRLSQLQTGCPHSLKIILIVENGGTLEKHVHDLLIKYKTRNHGGEWFSEESLGSVPDPIWEKALPWYMEDPDWWKRT